MVIEERHVAKPCPECCTPANCGLCAEGTVPQWIDLTLSGAVANDPVIQPFADYINRVHRLVGRLGADCSYYLPLSRSIPGYNVYIAPTANPGVGTVEWVNVDGTDLWMKWELVLFLDTLGTYLEIAVDLLCDEISGGPPDFAGSGCINPASVGCFPPIAIFGSDNTTSNCVDRINANDLEPIFRDGGCLDFEDMEAAIAA